MSIKISRFVRSILQGVIEVENAFDLVYEIPVYSNGFDYANLSIKVGRNTVKMELNTDQPSKPMAVSELIRILSPLFR